MRAKAWPVAVALVALSAQTAHAQKSLLEARSGFKTKLARQQSESDRLEEPPAGLFSIVKYPTSIGEMDAYLGASPGPGKHPAIIWITGGFPAGGIDASAWEAVPPDNDQSAKVYRNSGLVMMYPTLRGSFGNPGHQETFFGEVDDVLAALAYLRKVDYVDPDRIYLGGHSTGGTLALLVAEATDQLRAVFSFGPVSSPADYGDEVLTYDPSNERENTLRAPIEHLAAIKSPTWVIEGTERGNIESIDEMKGKSKNAKIRFVAVKGANHFDVLAPVNRLIAGKLAKLEGEAELSLSDAEIQGAFDDLAAANREANDLRTVAAIRQAGLDIGAPQTARHYLLAREKAGLEAAAKDAARDGFASKELVAEKDQEGRAFYVLILTKKLTPRDLDAVFAASKAVEGLGKRHELQYDGWDVE